MAGFNFGDFSKELNEVEEEGLTFEDGQKTWDTSDDVKEVIDALNEAKTVHYLKLDGNTLGTEAAAAIGNALQRHPEFRKALWKNMFTRRLKNEIPIALKHLGSGLMKAQAQLTVLDLSDNALGPNGMVGLEDLLRSSACYSLQELRLNNCGLGIGGGGMLSAALLDCHKFSTAAGTPIKLKVFITGRNRLENDGACSLAKLFSTLQTLEEIAMPQNSIYHIGIGALAESFKRNPNLQVLNLNDNTITEKGAGKLADAFEFTPKLRDINFGDCLLRTNGAYCFASALQAGHLQLETIDLGFNEINSDGGAALIEAFLNKPNLRSLNLNGNNFGTEGRENIIAEMKNALRPEALESLEEDNSEQEDENYDEGEEDVDDDEDAESDGYDDDYEHGNDTTEEADEYENYQDETAYVTTPAYTTKMFNESECSVKNVTSTTETISTTFAESFCLSQTPCTLQMFESLGKVDKLAELKKIINQFEDENYLLLLLFTTLKCAHLALSSKEALNLATELFRESFDYAVESKQEERIIDFFLIQLGLLREEEKFKSKFDKKSCRFALRETLNKQNIISDNIKKTFHLFLEQLDV